MASETVAHSTEPRTSSGANSDPQLFTWVLRAIVGQDGREEANRTSKQHARRALSRKQLWTPRFPVATNASLSSQPPRTSVHALARHGIRREDNNLPGSRTRSRSSLSLEHAPPSQELRREGGGSRILAGGFNLGLPRYQHLRGT